MSRCKGFIRVRENGSWGAWSTLTFSEWSDGYDGTDSVSWLGNYSLWLATEMPDTQINQLVLMNTHLNDAP